jgi:hypothetical protein
MTAKTHDAQNWLNEKFNAPPRNGFLKPVGIRMKQREKQQDIGPFRW